MQVKGTGLVPSNTRAQSNIPSTQRHNPTTITPRGIPVNMSGPPCSTLEDCRNANAQLQTRNRGLIIALGVFLLSTILLLSCYRCYARKRRNRNHKENAIELRRLEAGACGDDQTIPSDHHSSNFSSPIALDRRPLPQALEEQDIADYGASAPGSINLPPSPLQSSQPLENSAERPWSQVSTYLPPSPVADNDSGDRHRMALSQASYYIDAGIVLPDAAAVGSENANGFAQASFSQRMKRSADATYESSTRRHSDSFVSSEISDSEPAATTAFQRCPSSGLYGLHPGVSCNSLTLYPRKKLGAP